MKIEWLVANVAAVRYPDRAVRAILEVILPGRFFGQFRPYVWSGEPHCDVGTEKRVVVTDVTAV